MSDSPRSLLSIGFFLFATALVFAQDTWTSVPSPTTENLWGICYGGGQFVAVGGGGTVLTSPDGTAWTARVSGTTHWLLSVADGGGLYVAVGDQGTVLSSSDGIAWTIRATGSVRLNGIAHSAAGYLAVGGAGTLVTSPDGIVWTAAATPFATTWQRGVIALDDTGTFRVTGAAGTRFDVRLTGGTPQLMARNDSDPRLDIEAIARAPDDPTVIAVAGSNGYVAGSENYSFTATSARFRGLALYNHARLIAVGDAGLIASGWYPFSTAVPSLSLSLKPTSAGLNSVAVGADAAVAIGEGGAIVRLPLLPEAPTFISWSSSSPVYRGQTATLSARFSGTPPLTYQWSRNGVPVPGATRDTLMLSSVSTEQAGDYTVTASNGYGSASPPYGPITLSVAYVPPSTVVDPNFRTRIVPRKFLGETADQRLLFYGTKDATGATSSLLRLNADGSFDPTFQSAITPYYASPLDFCFITPIDGMKSLFYGATTESYPLLRLIRLMSDGSIDPTFSTDGDYGYPTPLPDGRILCFAMTGMDQVIATRLRAEGTRDSTLAPYTVQLRFPDYAHSYESRPRTTVDTQGRTYVVYTLLLSHAAPSQSFLFRILSDGTLDPSFAPKTTAQGIDRIWWIDGHLYYDSGKNLVGAMTGYARDFGRLTESGDPDPSYPSFHFSGSPPTGTFDRAGGLLLTSGPSNTDLIHYDSAGRRDYAFSARLDQSVGINVLSNGQLLVSGSFDLLNGVATQNLAKLTPITDAYATRLTNLSLRTTAGSDADTLIAGFVVARSAGQRSVLIRGVGPGLIPHGIPAAEALTDPQLTLYRGSAASAANDDWSADLIPTANAVGAFALATGSKDAALLASLAPASYAAHVSSRDGTLGVALAEIYDTDPAPASAAAARLANVSGRSLLRSADDSLIAGFVIAGKATQRVLIRAVGPTLADYNVPNVLPNPRLTLYREHDAIAANDDWGGDNTRSQLFATVGAFPLRPMSTDATLVIDLPPGTYSAVANGVGGATGAVLVEVYEVP